MFNRISGFLQILLTGTLLSLPLVSSYGQTDTILTLLPVEVTAQRIDFTDIGKHADRMDTSALSKLRYQTLANMLAGQTPLYLRSYGNGTLTTLGVRGGSA